MKRLIIILLLLPFACLAQTKIYTHNGKVLTHLSKPITTPIGTVAPIPFSPADLPNLALWLKADAGITKDGSNYVSAWADQSGNGNNATQGSGLAQPLWVDGVLNNKPVLRFDGVNDFMQFNEISNARTLFFVIKHDKLVNYEYPPLLGHPTKYDFHGNNGTGLLIFSFYTSPNILNGSGYVNGIYTAPSNIQFPFTYKTITLITTGNVYAQYITNDRNIAGRIWKGEYAEIIIYSSVLSDINRQAVENYLKSKYGHY